jgi:hypothetical protein
MTIAQGSLSKIGIQAESSYGVTPGSPQLVSVPFTSFSVNMTQERHDDMSIQADRMLRYNVGGNKTIVGDLDCNLSATNYDSLLESLCQSAFSANVLKVGSTRKSFVMEHSQTDISQFTVYNGVIVDKMVLTIPVAGLVTAKFSLVGQAQAALAGTTVSTLAYTAAAARQPYIHNTGTFSEGGSTVGYLTSLALTVDNGYATNYALGNYVPRDFSTSFAKISGTAQAYFESASLYNKFVNGTASSLEASVTDGTHTLDILLPNISYTAGNKTVSGQGPVVIDMNFTALYSSGSASNIVFTRS